MSYQRETVYHGKRFNVEKLTGVDERGKSFTREVVRHPGAVVVLPVLDDNHVVMIENYRVAVGATLLELPAGTREPNEPPEVTAERELIEETGYRAGRIERFHSFYASPGIMDEEMILYLATDLTPGEPERESGEEIENRVLTWDEAMQALSSGRIKDAKSIVGLLLYRDRMRK